MVGDERTPLLVPVRNSEAFSNSYDEEQGLDESPRKGRLSLAWTPVLVIICGLASLSRWIPERQGSDNSVAETMLSTQKDFSFLSKPLSVDAQIDKYEEWNRQKTAAQMQPLQSKSLFYQHLEMAQQITNWQAWRSNIQDSWESTKPHLQKSVSQAVGSTQEMLQNAESAVSSKSGEWQKNEDQQWQAFLDSSGAAMTVALQQAQDVLNSTLKSVENEKWWNNMSDWFQHTWTEYADEAHEVWVKLKAKAAEDEQTMWNHTVENERVWYANSLANMRKLGTNMQEWWSSVKDEVRQDEEVIQQNFKQWWNTTEEKERVWWLDTRKAFKKFTLDAEAKEKLWWDMIKHSTKDLWNDTVLESKHLWKATKEETAKAWNVTTNAVETGAGHAWEVTTNAERELWNTAEKWFRAHATYAEELAQPLEYLNTTSAFDKLMNGYGWFDYSHDFFSMQQGWDAQINQAYCGVASAAAIMNSLRSLLMDGDNLPVDKVYKPYHYATQVSLMETNLTCVNQRVVRYNSTFDGILHPPYGLSLERSKELLVCNLPKNEFDISVRHVDPATLDIDEVRMELVKALRDSMARVFINYDRKTLGQEGGGHFSPLASYYGAEDRFLVMDVAKYKYPAAWVPAARLFASMATLDTCGRTTNSLPKVQDKLPTFSSSADMNYANLERQLQEMGCNTTYRGYIIVRHKGSPTKR